MPRILVDVDEKNSTFVLSGDIDLLLANRRAKIFLIDFLAAAIKRTSIEIGYIPEERDYVIKKIIDFLAKFGFAQLNSQATTSILQEFIREEENFKIFSLKAYQIRNNELDESHVRDFSEFTNILRTKLTFRILYPLQLLSAYHLAFSQNACNFSVPGAGKTSVVYGAFAYLSSLEVNDPKFVNKLMIIGPLSSFGPWESEYKECFGREPNSKRLSGGVSKKERVAHFYSSDPAEITLLSYNSVPTLEEDLKNYLTKYRVMVVLDEAHRIKNTTGGIIAEAVLRFAKYCRSRIILTGTPAPNGYEDINNLFKFIWPTKNIIPFHLFQLKEISETAGDPRISILIDSVSPYFIRIRKSDLKIPEPINHEPTYVAMGDIQREIYDYIEKNYIDYFESANQSEGLKAKFAQARLVRLMQASTNPALLKKPITDYFEDEVVTDNFIDDSAILNKILTYESFETPSKFIKAKQLIEEILARGEKVVIWAVFVQNVEDFQKYLEAQGIVSEIIYGATPVETDDLDPYVRTREKIIAEFHSPKSKFKVLIANPFAVSESISLHKVCHNAIYLERSFNAAHFIQSKDRIHRYGLYDDDKIHYYYILSDNNTDFTIHQRLAEKEKRMMEIIESEQIPLFSRIDDDEDDIKAIINNYAYRTHEHKNLGNISDILFVLQNVISEKPRAIDDIKRYCSDKSIDLIYAIDGILALLEFIGIISRSRNSVKLHRNISIDWIDTTDNVLLSKIIVEAVLKKIRDEAFLNDFIPLERIRFDPAFNQISIPNNSIPLHYSSIKNLLIDLGGLKIYTEFPNFLFIDNSLQPFFETDIVPGLIEENEKFILANSKSEFPLDKFLELQELKYQYGVQAEEYVLEFEKARLAKHPLYEQIRRISNFDIGAGYDIVSFEDLDSKFLDRFIEVKSFSKFPEFYWSKNEVRTAEIKRDGYYLYLVDRDQMGTNDYRPTVVREPYINIFQNQKWQKDARTWLVKQEFELQVENDQPPNVFISYSHEDRTFAKKMAGELVNKGNNVWWDYSALKGGQDWQNEIQKAIIECKYFLVILTPQAVISDWVGNEITLAIQKNKMIIPLYLRTCEVPLSIIKKQYINFEKQTHKAAFSELIGLLKIQGMIGK